VVVVIGPMVVMAEEVDAANRATKAIRAMLADENII
jgi:hypothetical protein